MACIDFIQRNSKDNSRAVFGSTVVFYLQESGVMGAMRIMRECGRRDDYRKYFIKIS